MGSYREQSVNEDLMKFFSVCFILTIIYYLAMIFSFPSKRLPAQF